MENFKMTMRKMFAVVAWTSISLHAAFSLANSPSDDVANKFDCSTDKSQCAESAKSCGELAGLNWAAVICVAKQKRPHPDYVWQQELFSDHCMGYLPQNATFNDPILKGAFEKAYESALVDSMKASGCEDAKQDPIPSEAQSAPVNKSQDVESPIDPGFSSPFHRNGSGQ
jgi:hypothetical protein